MNPYLSYSDCAPRFDTRTSSVTYLDPHPIAVSIALISSRLPDPMSPEWRPHPYRHHVRIVNDLPEADVPQQIIAVARFRPDRKESP